MSREPAVTYLTRSKHGELKQELHELETTGRAQIAALLRRSPPSGMGRTVMDPAREKQVFLESRIAELRRKLVTASIIGDWESSQPGEQVVVGATVTVLDLVTSRTEVITLVGPDDLDEAATRISVFSPVGQSLLGRRVGDLVDVKVPTAILHYRVEKIELIPL